MSIFFKEAKDAIEWIHSRLKFGPKPGLRRVEELLRRLHHPEKDICFIHVAGTNGKGSTVRFLSSLLEEIGLKVGSFISPYIVTFNERIQINRQFISDEALLNYVNLIFPFVKQMDETKEFSGVTEFEINTVLSFLYFKEKKVDVALMEVGLGGQFDSTNVIQPCLTAITTIGYDHMAILGDTLEKIAAQKAGILKDHVPIVTGNISFEALDVIQKVAKTKQCPIYRYQKEYKTHFLKDTQTGETFDYHFLDHILKQVDISLMGRHQIENASVALTLFFLFCQKFNLSFQTKEIKKALNHTFWPARMEIVNYEPFILLDGAHNDHAVKRLVENTKKRFSKQHVWFLYAALMTKDIDDMLTDLTNIPNSHVIVTTFDHPKALDHAFLEKLKKQGFTTYESWQEALYHLLQELSTEDVLIITGSLYFSSYVRALFIS